MHQSLVFFVLFLLSPTQTLSLSDPERSSLLHFKSANPLSPVINKWTPFFHHCSWPGITCDPSRHVISLNVTGNLTGGILTASVGNLTALKILILPFHRFRGKIPESIWKLENLQVLNLEGNLFSQRLDSVLEFPKKLEILNLSNNRITGTIPIRFCGLLKSLKYLNLAHTNLSGHIPAQLATLKNLCLLILDNNKLSGRIPSGLSNMNLSVFNAFYNNNLLETNLNLNDAYVFKRNANSESYTNPPAMNNGNGFTSIEIASIASASAIVAVLLALIVLYVYSRKCIRQSSVASIGSRQVAIFVDIGVSINYETVVRATGNFNASNCIGCGGFGATYKAEISPGVVVAIKRLSVGRVQGARQFHAEIKTLGRCQHQNLVTLIGYHLGEEFLVYNYLPGGNLEKFIQERSRNNVNWRMLHKIALDVAKALFYLHDQCEPRILHRDVKPSNILLDNDHNAYLSDFGLARLLGDTETHATTSVAGTYGYVAPEYAMTCRVSDKADVYSYGVVLLELISDKKALDPSFSPYANGFNIVTWAMTLLEQGRAREFFIEGLWNVAPHDDLVEMLNLAVKCTDDSLAIRPTMKQVVRTLKEIRPPVSS